MANPLQEQLLKAGLTKKHQVEAAVRQQNRERDGKIKANSAEQVNAHKLQAERAERDRALAAERNAQARAKELRAQIRQIVETHRVPTDGEISYRFVDEGKIKTLLVSDAQRKQLAKGTLVIVRQEQGYELLSRTAAEMIYERAGAIVVDHGRNSAPAAIEPSADDAYYQKFVVPDDLIW